MGHRYTKQRDGIVENIISANEDRIIFFEKKIKTDLSPNLNRGFLIALVTLVLFLAASTALFLLLLLTESPSFSVTTHSLALPASSRPMKVVQ